VFRYLPHYLLVFKFRKLTPYFRTPGTLSSQNKKPEILRITASIFPVNSPLLMEKTPRYPRHEKDSFSTTAQCGKETTRIVDSTLLQNTIACQEQNGLN